MTTTKIIETYLTQGKHNNASNEEFYASLSINLKRADLIQVLKDKKHMDGIISGDIDSWYALNSWSDLVAMMDCCLGLRTDSFLNTLV